MGTNGCDHTDPSSPPIYGLVVPAIRSQIRSILAVNFRGISRLASTAGPHQTKLVRPTLQGLRPYDPNPLILATFERQK